MTTTTEEARKQPTEGAASIILKNWQLVFYNSSTSHVPKPLARIVHEARDEADHLGYRSVVEAYDVLIADHKIPDVRGKPAFVL
mgnify:CR=1 FL=1|jgi:hypothetical protein